MTTKDKKLFQDDFFIPHPGDLYDHMADERMSPTMWCIYSMILRQADFETGIWKGSAYKINLGWGGQPNLRTVQHNLKRLSEAGYIRRFSQNGRRGNYPVLVHCYPVRFGKWKGYRLNAEASTDPKNPLYERDTAPSQQSPSDGHASSTQNRRDDDAETLQTGRVDPATSANPNASVPDTPDYPDPEDLPVGGQDSPDSKSNRNNSRKTSEPNSAVVVSDVPSQTTTDGRPSPQLDIENSLPALMVEIKEVFDRNCWKFNATKAHREKAMKMATAYGSSIFLGALDYWLRTAESETLFVTTGKDPVTGKENVEFRTWLLQEFIDSGDALIAIEKVKPYAHLTRGQVLEFLVAVTRDAIIDVTPDQVAMLEELLDELLKEQVLDMVVGAYFQVAGMTDFLAHATEYIRALECDDHIRAICSALSLKPNLPPAARDAVLELIGACGRTEAIEALKKGSPPSGWSLPTFVTFCADKTESLRKNTT